MRLRGGTAASKGDLEGLRARAERDCYLADLERRMRALERANGGPGIVTFNH
jgi:hypothetical protein